MRILMTADAAGGVGVLAENLSAALAARGHQVLLAVFSPTPPPDAPAGESGIERVWAPFRLEWMDTLGTATELASDIARGREFLASLARRWQPDLLHSNQFAYVDAIPGVSTLLAVHSDVVSWWREVRGTPPPDNAFQRWYRRLAQQALAQARVVIAPSQAARGGVVTSFPGRAAVEVVYNGGDAFPGRRPAKQPWAVTVGRLWDEAKQLPGWPDLHWPPSLEWIWAGEWQHPGQGGAPPPSHGARLCGRLSRAQTAGLLNRARAYVGTSRYEPFGLAVLEAAGAGCALLLHDIPSWRELWSPVAHFFRSAGELSRLLERVAREPQWAEQQGEAARGFAQRHYPAERMARGYEVFYQSLG